MRGQQLRLRIDGRLLFQFVQLVLHVVEDRLIRVDEAGRGSCRADVDAGVEHELRRRPPPAPWRPRFAPMSIVVDRDQVALDMNMSSSCVAMRFFACCGSTPWITM
jgi:hypothetical protein